MTAVGLTAHPAATDPNSMEEFATGAKTRVVGSLCSEGLRPVGMRFDVARREWGLDGDVEVNYIMHAIKP